MRKIEEVASLKCLVKSEENYRSLKLKVKKNVRSAEEISRIKRKKNKNLTIELARTQRKDKKNFENIRVWKKLKILNCLVESEEMQREDLNHGISLNTTEKRETNKNRPNRLKTNQKKYIIDTN